MGTTETADPKPQKRCFVVMGFGIKTDLATGRKLNLDKSYQALIKPAVESKGIVCVRADEIKHSGTIDVPMYQQLLSADIVVADLSTANVNAFYELGIRHALCPRTTIIMSEEQLNYPFDVNHIIINKYTHLGDSIDYFEVLRFQKLLGETIEAVLNNDETDSPVYTFLSDLIPPSLKIHAAAVAREVGDALTNIQPKVEEPGNENNPTLSLIVKQAEASLYNKQFAVAKGLFMTAMLATSNNPEQRDISNNTYLTQRLALATYKAKLPDEVAALKEAMKLLIQIDLDHTNDSETVSLAGAIEKKLFLLGQGDDHLDSAVLCFQRSFFLLHNRYNSINLAYLLNCRVDTSLDPTDEDKIADLVWANRIRRDVLSLCTKDWNAISSRQSKSVTDMLPGTDISKTQEDTDTVQKFWILVNKAEAHFGLGEMEAYKQEVQEATSLQHDDWMMETFTKQIKSLEGLLSKHGMLLNPAWHM